MIWNSVLLMTIMDVVIISLTVASAWVIISHRRELIEAGPLRPTIFMLVGLSLIGAFYLVDLWMMHVLPRRTSPLAAMQAMESLHLNWNWLAALGAVGCVFAGLQSAVRYQLRLIGSLQCLEGSTMKQRFRVWDADSWSRSATRST